MTNKLMNATTNKLTSALALMLSSMTVTAVADEVVNFATTQGGIHQVSAADLQQAGTDLSGTPISALSLFNQGDEVPMQVLGGDTVGPDTVIRFIAQPRSTLYSDTNVYTLNLSPASVSITSQARAFNSSVPWAVSYLETVSYAPQSKYSFSSPLADDPWYAKRMVALGTTPANETITLAMDNVAPGGNSGTAQPSMTVNVWGATDLAGPGPDHHMKVAFNQRDVIDETFDGLSAQTFKVALDNISASNNRVQLTLPAQNGKAFDAVNVNSVEVRYPRRFVAKGNSLNFASQQRKFRIRGFTPTGTTAQGRPSAEVVAMRQDASGVYELSNTQVACRETCTVSVSGGGGAANYFVAETGAIPTPQIVPLAAPQDIRSGEAKYLIISHPDFIGAAGNNLLETYASELQSEMGSVAIVDVEAIYAQFGHHLFDPQAIRDYIAFAEDNLGTEIVLLVGGDMYDYKQFENEDATSFIPSIYAATGSNITFAPVDAKYVDTDDDNVPNMAIGRLPVRTTAHLASLMAKRSAYLARDYGGKALMVADEYDQAQQYDFGDDADEVHQAYLSDYQVQKAYVDDLGVSAARQRVKDEINAGTTLTAFFGHSSTNQWSFSGLFTGPDAAQLSNADKPTVVTQWGCWNAYYVSPSEDSMGHRFLMEGDRGAVAVMGASTLTSADAERRLARKVFARLAQGERLGEAVTNAKQEHALTHPNDLDVLLGWTVLGMPELMVN